MRGKTGLLIAVLYSLGCGDAATDSHDAGCDGGKCDDANGDSEVARDGGLVRLDDRDPDNPAYVRVCDDDGQPLGPQFERYCGRFETVDVAVGGPGIRGFLPPNEELHRSYQSMNVVQREGLAAWTLFASPGQFLRRISLDSQGMINVLGAFDVTYVSRDDRFETFGMLNDPGCKPNTVPDRFGFVFDDCKDPYSSGLAGFRLMPNPEFDEESWLQLGGWDGQSELGDEEHRRIAMNAKERHLADWSAGPEGPQLEDLFEIDGEEVHGWEVEPPYLPSLTCGTCHLAPNPLNPPRDINDPQWDEMVFALGNQFFREGDVFGWRMDRNSVIFEALHAAQRPGTSDTSRVATDTTFNPNTINAVANLAYRPRFWEASETPGEGGYFNPDVITEGGECDVFDATHPLRNGCFPLDIEGNRLGDADPECVAQCQTCVEDNGACVHTFHVLKDGADSSGPTGALLRVFVNVGACAGDLLEASGEKFTFFAGERETPMTPLSRRRINEGVEQNGAPHCPEYVYMAQKALPTFSYLLYHEPYLLGDVDADHDAAGALSEVYGDATVDIDGQPTPLVDPDVWPLLSQAVVERGAQVFAANCATCHSSVRAPTGEDEGPFFSDHLQERVDLMYAASSSSEFLDTDSPAVTNFFSGDERIPWDVVQTNYARAYATNAIDGGVWEEYASKDYRTLEQVDFSEPGIFDDDTEMPLSPFPGIAADSLFNPLRGFLDAKPQDGDRVKGQDGLGYYRSASLLNIWNSAPFANNNGIGEIATDQPHTVRGRLATFRLSLDEILTVADDRPERMAGAKGTSVVKLSFLLQGMTEVLGIDISERTIGTGPGSSLAALVTMTERMFVDGFTIDLESTFAGTDPFENRGHEFGTGLDGDDKLALHAFLLTL